MNSTILLVALILASAPQESTRVLEKPGEHFKHLTIDTVDRWLLTGVDDEVLRVDIRSSDFDPVLELVRVDEGGRVTEVLVPEVDDAGSTSHMLLRLPRGGPIAILVHGPQNRGGGSYRLYVERLRSEPLPQGLDFLVGRLDDEGYAHVRVRAEGGDMIVPRGANVAEVLDPKGFSLGSWRGCFSAERAGEHYLRLKGEPKAPFRVGLAPVPRRVLELGSKTTATLGSGGLDEWIFETTADGMQLVELVGAGLETRILLHGDRPGGTLDRDPTHRWIKAHSKGQTHRTALVARVAVGQRLQIRSSSDRPTPYQLEFRDPTNPLPLGARTEGALPVGGSQYWTFDAEPGQVLRVDVKSNAFDPVLRLFDALGRPVAEADDAGGDLSARHSWLVTTRGRIYAEVLSYGSGGGGAYSIGLSSLDVPHIAVGERVDGTLTGSARAYWHVDIGEHKQLLVLVNADTFDPGLTLYDPNGVQRAAAWSAREEGGVVVNLHRPGAGRYTLVVETRDAAGPYSVRILDPNR